MINPNIPEEIYKEAFDNKFSPYATSLREANFMNPEVVKFYLVWNSQISQLLFCMNDVKRKKRVIFCDGTTVFRSVHDFITKVNYTFDSFSIILRELFIEYATELGRAEFYQSSYIDIKNNKIPHLHLIYTFNKFPSVEELRESFPEYFV